MGRWSNSPAGFLDQVEEDLVEQQKDMAAYALNRIISASPVDSGAYRRSHVVTVDSEDHTTQSATEAEGQAEIQSLSKPYGVLTIQSNSPYGERLEHGHSQQAPAGVYGRAVLATKARFR